MRKILIIHPKCNMSKRDLLRLADYRYLVSIGEKYDDMMRIEKSARVRYLG